MNSDVHHLPEDTNNNDIVNVEERGGGRRRTSLSHTSSHSSSSDAAAAASASASASSVVSSSQQPPLTMEQQRRASIQAIMKDTTLNETERRRSIQFLMDGRRRSSLVHFLACNSNSGNSSNDYNSSNNNNNGNNNINLDRVADILSSSSDVEDESYISGIPPSISSSCAVLKRRSHPTSESMWESLSTGSNVNSLRSLRIGEIQMNNNNDRTFNILGNVAYNIEGDPIGDPKKLIESSPECTHYDRKCSMIAPCCGMVFGCRLCHDECDQLNPPIFNVDESALNEEQEQEKEQEEEPYHIPQKIKLQSGPMPSVSRRGSVNSIMSSISEMGDDVHHNINRFAVKEIICRECFTRQSSKTNECIHCKVQFGEYHCDICNLWMSANDKPYHCDECGFCRVGGRDKFRHCKGCGMCIDVNMFPQHNCKAGKYMANCPVCYEDLYTSRMLTHEMPCGHNIHWHCFKSLASHDIRCPICKKTATYEDMSDVWDGLAQDIADQPLPPDQTKCVDIVCNDCGTRDENRRWHYLGVQCRSCGTFNTSHNTRMQGVQAHEYLNALEAEQRYVNENDDYVDGGNDSSSSDNN